MTKFFVCKAGDFFITVKPDHIKGMVKTGRTRNLQKAAYWKKKGDVKTWVRSLKEKFGEVEVVPVEFKLVEE